MLTPITTTSFYESFESVFSAIRVELPKLRRLAGPVPKWSYPLGDGFVTFMSELTDAVRAAQPNGGPGHVSLAGPAIDYSGAAAIRRLEAWTPDALISELVLPEIGGLDLASHVRRRHPECVLIAVSSYGRPEDRARAVAAGFQHHFLKPLEIESFIRFLHDVLRVVADSESN